jgi:hypothetical protein
MFPKSGEKTDEWNDYSDRLRSRALNIVNVTHQDPTPGS